VASDGALGRDANASARPHVVFRPGNQSKLNGAPELPIATVIMNVARTSTSAT